MAARLSLVSATCAFFLMILYVIQAQHHYLLIPKAPQFSQATASDLVKAHLPALKALHRQANEFGEAVSFAYVSRFMQVTVSYHSMVGRRVCVGGCEFVCMGNPPRPRTPSTPLHRYAFCFRFQLVSTALESSAFVTLCHGV
jgi:hypothetical protein